jgi:hypothetical protein
MAGAGKGVNTVKTGKKRLWKRYVVLFALGSLLGGAAVLFWYGHELEELMLQNTNLTLENERLMEEMENLKQSQKVARKRQEMVIEEIRVTVLDAKPQQAIIEAEVIRRIEKDLAQLKGKKTEQVAELHSLLHELLRRREYFVERNMVEVRLKTAVISRVLHLFVTAEIKHGEVGQAG